MRIKGFISVLLLIATLLSLTSCGIYTGEINGDLEKLDSTTLLYKGKEYSIADEIVSVELDKNAVLIGSSNGFKTYSYYTDGSENPPYIYCAISKVDYDVYLRDDLDFSSLTYSVEDTDLQIKFCDSFYDMGYDTERQYLSGYNLTLSSVEYPWLNIYGYLRWSEGWWYMDKRFMLTGDFTKSLTEYYLPVNNYPRADLPELEGVNKLRQQYDCGVCSQLRGRIAVAIFYLDDFESKWTEDAMYDFQMNIVLPALDYIEREAVKYGVELSFEIAEGFKDLYYDGNVHKEPKVEGYFTSNILYKTAHQLYYFSDEKMIEKLKTKYEADEVLCIAAFNKYGGSGAYTVMDERGYDSDDGLVEHLVAFAADAGNRLYSKLTPERLTMTILYLYGAESLKNAMWRYAYCRDLYPNDIMYDMRSIEDNVIGKATAFYIGWADDAPRIMYDEKW